MVTKVGAVHHLVRSFFAAKCEFEEGKRVRSSVLYKAFVDWIQEGKIPLYPSFQVPMRRAFTTVLKRAYDMKFDKANDGVWILGIYIKQLDPEIQRIEKLHKLVDARLTVLEHEYEQLLLRDLKNADNQPQSTEVC